MKKFILLLISLFFIIGCGGGGGGGSSSVSSTQDITATLLDSPISGVSYHCGDIESITNANGQFTCKENTTVSFNIGGVLLGSTMVTPNMEYITPAALYNLDENNIIDSRVLNFLQFIQSLDEDNNPTNGITVAQITATALIGETLDITNSATTQNDINNTLTDIGKTMVLQADALEHYKDTLTKTLDITLQNEPYYLQQWYLNNDENFYVQNNINQDAHIHAEELLKQYTGHGIKVAIIDDGLDTTHEDLEGAITNTYDTATQSSNVSHSSSTDNHGTAVTGIIGARVNNKGIHGIANEADIIFLKLKDTISDSETIELFNKAEEFGADIINCSWGTYDVSMAVKEKIQNLSHNGRNGKGMIIVFSSGNFNRDMGNDESSIPEVFAVGATDKDNFRTYYSNYGPNLDIMAPGGVFLGITTLDPMLSNGVDSNNSNYLLYNDPNGFAGTSASAPIVSGAIALMLEKNPELTRTQIETLFQNTSDKIGTLPYQDGRNDYYGYGKLNLTNIFNNL